MKYLGIIIIFITVFINLIKDWKDYRYQRKNEDRNSNEPRKIFIAGRKRNKGVRFFYIIAFFYLVGFVLEGIQVFQTIKQDNEIETNVKTTRITSDNIFEKTGTVVRQLDSAKNLISKMNDSLLASINDVQKLRDVSQVYFDESKGLLSTINSQNQFLSNRLPEIIYVDLEITWSIYSASGSIDRYLKRNLIESIDDKINTSTQRRFVMSDKTGEYYPALFMAFKNLRFTFSKSKELVTYMVNIFPQSFVNFKNATRFYNSSDFNIYRNAEFIYDQGQKTFTFRIRNCPLQLFTLSSPYINMLDIENSDLSILLNKEEGELAYELTDMQAEYLFSYGWYFALAQGDLFKCKGSIKFPGFSSIDIQTTSQNLFIKKLIFNLPLSKN